jgi:Zn-dependent peptidase ImmA (M78 family)
MDNQLGERIAARIDALVPRTTRKAFAARVGMKDDALSRALSGQRGISSLELVAIAEALDADIHELVTGVPDPRRVTVLARHDYDGASMTRSVPTWETDEAVLENVRIAVTQAQVEVSGPAVATPADPEEMRRMLGEGFTRPFIDRIEETLGVHVVRVAEIGTAYTGLFSGLSIITIPAKGNWFRENWDLAHELGHLAGRTSEDSANAFAAELLLPAGLMKSVDWVEASPQTVADFLWDTGVSTEALRHRLSALGLMTDRLKRLLAAPTQRLLRSARSWSHAFGDEITERMDAAARRRFPLPLQEAHERRIEAGEIGPAYLAWMRGVDEQWIADAYEPVGSGVDVEDLARALGVDVA